MLATSRFMQYQECDVLLSKLAPEEYPHIHSFYEWIDPTEDHPEGSFPFRTGISAVRIAIADIIQRIKKGVFQEWQSHNMDIKTGNTRLELSGKNTLYSAVESRPPYLN
jgi:hypothetical protein